MGQFGRRGRVGALPGFGFGRGGLGLGEEAGEEGEGVWHFVQGMRDGWSIVE